jgi:hypothetical protein
MKCTPRDPTPSIITFDDLKEASLGTKEWNSFHLSWKKLDYLHIKDVIKYECESYLKQPLTPPQYKIIATYCTSNHKFSIEIGQWSTMSISRDYKLCSYGILGL